jgi:acyl phosphate:glycerol-3-phosphate acyltransferase
MTPTSALLLSVSVGYLSGALPFGYIAGRLKGIDIRQHGSGNIGATNVIRVLGKGIGIPVFVLDLLKGWLPVWLASSLWLTELNPTLQSAGAVLAGLGAVLGHMYTFWLGFKGGKGVATTAGVLLGVHWLAMIGGLGLWLITFFATRYVSLASMVAGVGVAGTMYVEMSRTRVWDPVMLGFGILVMVLVIVRHRANIRRILDGTEPQAGRKKPE